MDRLHRIGRRASPSVGEATGLVTQKLYADGRGPCYTYTDDGNLATRTWARGVTTSYTYDAWGSLTSTTSSDGTLVATRPLYWQPRTSQGNFSLFYTHDGNKNVSEAVFYQRARGVAAHDEYAPFGEVTAQTRGNAWGTLDLATDNTWRSFIQLKRSGNQEWSLDIKGTFGPYYYSDIKLSRMTRTDKYGAQFITLYDAPGGAIYEKVVVEY